MMTDIDRDERTEEGGGARARARGGSLGPVAVLVPFLLAAFPPAALADSDGRADWRQPARAADTAGTSRSAEPSRDPDEESLPGGGPTSEPAARPGNASPVLGGIGPQRLRVGRPWRLHVRARDPDGEPPRLLVRNLPRGATLVSRRAGWHVLDWTPTGDATGRVDLTIVAVDARDDRLRRERVVRLEIVGDASLAGAADARTLSSTDGAGSPEPVADPPSPYPPESVTPPDPFEEDVPSVPRAAPRIAPLPAQVVSTGRTVAFKVAAVAADEGGAPLLQIDRLPRNASFDRNPDGSRTFHWPTGDSDQGEHRFRITALHPEDTSLASRVDLLVIVGDPTRAATLPLDEGGVADVDAFADDVPPPVEPSLPDASIPDPDDEPFLPQASSDEPGYFDPESAYLEDESMELPPEFLEEDFGDGLEPGLVGSEGYEGGDYFAPADPFDEGGELPLAPDGLPFEP